MSYVEKFTQFTWNILHTCSAEYFQRLKKLHILKCNQRPVPLETISLLHS
jgi:hypothetical protein